MKPLVLMFLLLIFNGDESAERVYWYSSTPVKTATLREIDSGCLKIGCPINRAKNNRKALNRTLISGHLLGVADFQPGYGPNWL